MNTEGLLCVVGHAQPLLFLSMLPVLWLQLIAEWRHVDWQPTLVWLSKTWALSDHEHFFVSILPRMLGQRCYGQWIELKKAHGYILCSLSVLIYMCGVLRIANRCF